MEILVVFALAGRSPGLTVAWLATCGAWNPLRLTAGATSFLNGTLGVTQQASSGATTSFIRDPNGNLISMRSSTGASFYYTTDALGSTILLTDSTQAAAATYIYDSWGNTTPAGTQAAVNPWQYARGYKDSSTGYTKFGARYYDSTIGRFTQADPSGKETNRYAYVQCNPINATDPSGLDAWGCFVDWFGITAGIIGFGIGVLAAPLSFGGSVALALTGAGTVLSGWDAIKNGCY
ncbi:RHS repeat-associated core domain-containing protein [Arthrobacter sp. M4]|uniref:RHS repeat-associated core domain-containing protein n=1 Tax=Arthrobacter sp. M4 TaxID=218160 RepID=UPI001CDCF7E0|nr:RHS repeat-associated core domain-containing protein [Arthrobacter sp. M4]MCA4135310.1 RHS repeat-associated core domain-containing protein [Arthrobacter sp. M4]